MQFVGAVLQGTPPRLDKRDYRALDKGRYRVFQGSARAAHPST